MVGLVGYVDHGADTDDDDGLHDIEGDSALAQLQRIESNLAGIQMQDLCLELNTCYLHNLAGSLQAHGFSLSAVLLISLDHPHHFPTSQS